MIVLERTDTENRGKGHALAWAFDKLMHGETHYDAYIVLDADAVVEPAFLTALARGLARGGLALQAHNAVLNAAESATSALRWLALSLMNYIRPLGRNVWGGSSTLTGNGMCLTHEILTRHPWQAFGLSEDYQYYLSIVSSGEKVLFVPDATVRSVMPTTARQLKTQDIRWESLNPDASSWQRRIAGRLLSEGIRRHSWVRLDALAELMTPPLSVLAGGCAVTLVAAIALSAPLQIVLAVLLTGRPCHLCWLGVCRAAASIGCLSSAGVCACLYPQKALDLFCPASPAQEYYYLGAHEQNRMSGWWRHDIGGRRNHSWTRRGERRDDAVACGCDHLRLLSIRYSGAAYGRGCRRCGL